MAFIDQKFIFAVGQKSFIPNETTFSTLIPIATLDGEIVENRLIDFPNRGRVWWMVRGEQRVT